MGPMLRVDGPGGKGLVRFRDTLAAMVVPEWKDRYLDYVGLTDEILEIQMQEAEVQRMRSMAKENPTEESRLARRQLDFTRLLDEEIEKVVTFYLEVQGQLASRLWTLRRRERADAKAGGTGAALTLCAEYQALARDMGKLLDYACINIDAIRKILRKFDASATESPQLAVAWLQSRRMSRYSAVAILFDDTGLKALVGGIRRGFETVNLRLKEQVLKDAAASGRRSPATSSSIVPMSVQLRRAESQDLDSLEHKVKRLEHARKKIERGWMDVRSDILLERSHLERELWGDEEGEDGDVTDTDESQHRPSSASSVNNGSSRPRNHHNHHHIPPSSLPTPTSFDAKRMEKVVAQYVEPSKEGYSLGLCLNLASTFLYLLNYFVAIPTMPAYAQQLGVDESISGVVLSALPFAAMVSALLFSQWTNSSFRQPLLLSVCLQLTGNLLYALAYPARSLSTLLLGRFVMGLGAIRPINRRYIAECVSLNVRTAAASAFVATGALGMAAGPALSLAFRHVDYSVGDWVVVNQLTAPGWCMFVVWLLYLVILVEFFQEPRQYLFKQRADIEKRLLSKVKAEGLLARRGESYGSMLDMDATIDEEMARDGEEALRKRKMQEEEQARLLDASKKSSLLGAATWKLVWAKITQRRVALCLWFYFLLKFVTEVLFASSPIVTRYVFADWPDWGVGSLFTVLGLAVIPLNYVMSYTSLKGAEDRQILLTITWLSLLCVVALLPAPYFLVVGEYPKAQYVLSLGALYCLMTALEGTVLSLLSKVLAKKLTGTTFNAGLLGTEFASLGRVAGDLSVTVLGSVSKPLLLDLTFTPVLAALLILLLATYHLYDDLAY